MLLNGSILRWLGIIFVSWWLLDNYAENKKAKGGRERLESVGWIIKKHTLWRYSKLFLCMIRKR